MKNTSLLFVLCLASLALVPVRVEQAATDQPAPSVAPVTPSAGNLPPKPPVGPAASMHPMPSMPFAGPQSGLTPEESKILGQARMELQKDSELVELNNQIKALMDKRMKLTEEKLLKSNPEAAALVQKLKDKQEKMMAERKAQMEAAQAKYKAQIEAATSPVSADKPTLVPTPAAVPALTGKSI